MHGPGGVGLGDAHTMGAGHSYNQDWSTIAGGWLTGLFLRQVRLDDQDLQEKVISIFKSINPTNDNLVQIF